MQQLPTPMRVELQLERRGIFVPYAHPRAGKVGMQVGIVPHICPIL
jgi:hypothetical protein